MDDLSAKLGELLNDPETVSKIGEMAKNLFPEQESQNEGNSPDMLKIMSLINRFKEFLTPHTTNTLQEQCHKTRNGAKDKRVGDYFFNNALDIDTSSIAVKQGQRYHRKQQGQHRADRIGGIGKEGI